MNPLEGKVAIVTGASSGIGEAISMELAKNGVKLILAARRFELLKQVKINILKEIGYDKDNHICIFQMDITKKDEVKYIVNEGIKVFGLIDILVNNAGMMRYELLKNTNIESWERMIDVNCKGFLYAISSVLKSMIDKKSGHIINISSDAAKKVFPGLGVYSASKMFIEGISQALRLENIGSGIRITSIQPGNVKTDLVHHANQSYGVDKEAMELYGQPTGHQILVANDISKAVLYALSQPSHVAINEILIEPTNEPI